MKTKKFDCVKMKLELQEKLYKETENLNLQEFVRYIQNDLKKSELMEHFRKGKTRTNQV
ncbi:MAG: hypothetical protein H8E57_06770 [Candidatus Cloacimonetes bacterium]|nr:hypothetical protein [Candidatus Cloacimonadota bacterium]